MRTCFVPRRLHAWNGAARFRQGRFAGLVNFLSPIADGRAKPADFDARLGDLVHQRVKGLVGNVMNVARGIAGDFHHARLDVLPAEFLGGLDLRVNRRARFVRNAGEIHKCFIG